MDILNPRRFPRVPLRCAVDIRHRLSTWSGQTEDVGPGGCQIVSPRSVDPGREVKLVIRCDALGRPLGTAGKVVWARPDAPARLGVAFKPDDAEAGWFEALLAADPVAERFARSLPDRLPRQTRVYLGKPPQRLVDFSAAEADLLRRVGPGVTLDALARSFGPELDGRVAGALFSLVARHFLVFDRVSSVGVARWREVLAGEDARSPGRGEADRAVAAHRPAPAQRLYEEAMVHIGAGRLGLAVDRLRDALRLSPGDDVIEATLKRISKWA